MMMSDVEVKDVLERALADLGVSPAALTGDGGSKVAASLRAYFLKAGATEAELERYARTLIDRSVSTPGATAASWAGAIRAISSGFGFDAKMVRTPDGSVAVALTPKRTH
jgi:hypothetical protein